METKKEAIINDAIGTMKNCMNKLFDAGYEAGYESGMSNAKRTIKHALFVLNNKKTLPKDDLDIIENAF